MSSQGPWHGPFQYGGAFGYHTDSDYGLKHLGARYYDSTTGRFLSRDPIKDGRNWYVYCDGNPVAWGDPTGLKVRVIGFGPEDEERVRDQLNKLKNNPATRQLMYELVNDPKDHVISPKNASSVPWSGYEPAYYDEDSYKWFKDNYPEEWRKYGPVYIPDGGRIRYDPNETVQLRGQGYLPHPEAVAGTNLDIYAPPLVVLAHELGHAYGYKDPPKETPEHLRPNNLGKNVEKVENPLRKTLGLSDRTRYFSPIR